MPFFGIIVEERKSEYRARFVADGVPLDGQPLGGTIVLRSIEIESRSLTADMKRELTKNVMFSAPGHYLPADRITWPS